MTMPAEQPESVVVPRKAVQRLILAADSYGVRHLDSDDLSDEAQELQDATEAMKDMLAAAPRQPTEDEIRAVDAAIHENWPNSRAMALGVLAVARAAAPRQPQGAEVVVPVHVLNEAAGVLDCEGYGPLSRLLLSCLDATPAPVGREHMDWLKDRIAKLEASAAKTYSGGGVDAALANAMSRMDGEEAEHLRAILAALSRPAPVAGEAVSRDIVAAAFEAGAMSVHEYWTENPGEAPRGDPEFSEAAHDYAASVVATPTPQPAAARGGEVLLQEAAALFRHYEAHHRAKGGIEKAEINADIAGRIEAHLSDLSAKGGS